VRDYLRQANRLPKLRRTTATDSLSRRLTSALLWGEILRGGGFRRT